MPLVFAKRLCDVFDDEVDRIAEKVGSRVKSFKLVARDQKLVRFYLPLEPDDPEEPVWSVIRKLSDKIGEQLTTHLREIAKANPLFEGIIDRIDFNATTHGQRDIDDDRLSNLIEKNEKRKKEQAQKGFDGLNFFVYRTLLDEGVSGAEEVSDQVKAAFAGYPNWQTSEAELRELRKEVTFAIYAKMDDLDQVARIVDNLFSLLAKAYKI